MGQKEGHQLLPVTLRSCSANIDPNNYSNMDLKIWRLGLWILGLMTGCMVRFAQ